MERRLVIVLLVFLIETWDRVSGSCNLSLKQDFGSPSPVFLRNGEYLAPSADGAILLRRAETLHVACPGNNKFVVIGNDTTNLDVIAVKCVSNSTFRASRPAWAGALREMRCSAPPWFSAERTNATCGRHGRHHIYRVGYSVLGEFRALYEACFDRGRLSTRYVKHELGPASWSAQLTRRPQFIEGDVFSKVRMSQVYKLSRQRERLAELLGPGMPDRYLTKHQFLNRGHLAAKADFPLAALQRASFHYINAAPQWLKGNAGDWAALEEALRRRLKTYGAPVAVYTGAHGVLALADHAGAPRQVFLHADQNNNGVVPVPLYFYKLVYDPQRKLATAFVSINSPYYNSSALARLTFCDDACAGAGAGAGARLGWLAWRPGDHTHSFCCEYGQFVATVTDLPHLDVKGLFI